MSNIVTSLVKEHHALYEVLPYYILLEERHGNAPVTPRRVQAGFDVEIYGVNINDEMVVPVLIVITSSATPHCEKLRTTFRSVSTIPALSRSFRSGPLWSSTLEITRRRQCSESEFHIGGVLISLLACRNNTRLMRSKTNFTRGQFRAVSSYFARRLSVLPIQRHMRTKENDAAVLRNLAVKATVNWEKASKRQSTAGDTS